MIRRPVRDDSREREDIYHSGTSRTMERSDSNRRKRSRSRSMERSDSNRRKRSRSRSPVSRRRRMPCGRDDEAHDRLEIQDAVDRKVAQQIQEQAEKRVTDYINSNEFIVMVESLKRRERERVLTEIQAEVESQRNQLREDCNNICVQCSGYLRDIRMKGDAVDHASQADTILLQNKLRMEEQQRRQYEARQKEEAERLEQVLSKKRCEELLEQQRLESLHREHTLLELTLDEAAESESNLKPFHSESSEVDAIGAAPRAFNSTNSVKLSFGLKKRNQLC